MIEDNTANKTVTKYVVAFSLYGVNQVEWGRPSVLGIYDTRCDAEIKMEDHMSSLIRDNGWEFIGDRQAWNDPHKHDEGCVWNIAEVEVNV